MSSRLLRKQARRNGAKAAGTKSPAGIQKSSQNSLKHGLTSNMMVLSNESKVAFDELHQSYIATFQPTTAVEMDLIDQMVASQWRLRRIWMMQTAALDLKMDQQEPEIAKGFNQIDQATRLTVAFTTLANDEKSLDLLLRYETTFTRLHQRAMNTLMRLRRDTATNESHPESTISEELRNDPPAPAAEPEMIEKVTPYLQLVHPSDPKSNREASEPQPETTE